MAVDSFQFLPRLIATVYQMTDRTPELPIPWTPLRVPLTQARLALVTTAGLYVRDVQPPFDLERERREPTWGDPSLRVIANDVPDAQIGVSHLHINPAVITADLGVALPRDLLAARAQSGAIGGTADETYALMGYQGFPPAMAGWRADALPVLIDRLRAARIDGVLLTPV